jgi:hypothetical protein
LVTLTIPVHSECSKYLLVNEALLQSKDVVVGCLAV